MSHEDRGSLRVAKSAMRNKSRKPGSRPAPPRLTRAKREGAKEGKKIKLLRIIWSRNRLRNLSEGVSRAIFNADSEYAIGLLGTPG